MQAALVFESGHAANRLAGVEGVRLEGATVEIGSASAGDVVLVLKSDQPLEVASSRGAVAVLRAGWDGTLGYSLYGLHLAIPAAGPVSVALRATPPPVAPLPTTPADQARFETEFRQRPSRCPAEASTVPAWQEKLRAGLAKACFRGPLPERPPLAARVISTKEYPTFVLRRVEIESVPGRTHALLLSLPRGPAPAPLLLALHGHEADWGQAVEAAYSFGHADDFCAAFAERGWAVLQPATMDHTLRDPRWTLLGERTWDAMRALDYALALPEIDPPHAAVCGLSTGAHLAMNMLALDDRLRAGVVGCVLSTWNHQRTRFRLPPHCDCGIMALLSPHLEVCDWAALAAPKPVLYQHGRQDVAFCPGADAAGLNLVWNTGVMPVQEYEVMFAELRRVYELAGAPERVESRLHDGPHKVDNESALAWLNRWVGAPR